MLYHYIDIPTSLLLLIRELLGGEREGLIQLATDKALLSDPIFRPLVEKYAAVCRSFYIEIVFHHLYKLFSLLTFCCSMPGRGCLLCRLCRGSSKTFWIGVRSFHSCYSFCIRGFHLFIPCLPFAVSLMPKKTWNGGYNFGKPFDGNVGL